MVADGDADALAQRLGWDAAAKIRPVLGDVEAPTSWALPSWVATAAEFVATAKAFEAETIDVDAFGGELPFVEFLLPIVQTGRSRLLDALGDTAVPPPSALRSLEEGLARTLLFLTGEALQLEFSIFRATHTSSLSRAALEIAPSPPREMFERFIRNAKRDGFHALLDTYPVLARSIARGVDRWVACSAELLARLTRDRSAIVDTLLQRRDTGDVRTISAGWSDPHGGGRTVHVLTFEDGSRVVYKPRELAIDIAFGEFLEWLGRRTVDLRIPRTLDRGDYGWVQFIEYRPCRSADDLTRYYRRAGILLAAVYALEGSDLHYENVIASGEHPVIVDLEMLFQPTAVVPPSVNSTVEELVASQLADTVFRTGLLPRWELQPDGECIDVSGLGSVESQSGGMTVEWAEPNTDRMRSFVRATNARRGANAPFASGGDPEEHVGTLIDGFRESYSVILGCREELIDEHGVLAKFRDLPARFLFRSTRGYASLLQYSVRPEFLTNGAERSILCDRLSRGRTWSEDSPFALIMDAEIEAVEEFDIPRFSVTTTSRDLSVGRESIRNFFTDTGWTAVHRRLGRMSAADRDRQCGFIAASFATRRETQRHTKIPSGKRHEPAQSIATAALTEYAGGIARRLIDSAAHSYAGAPTWISVSYSSEARRYELIPAGSSIYDGDGGIALFLAAWARHAGDAHAGELARAVGQAIGARVDTASDDPELSRLGIGAGLGWGSVVYTLLRLGLLLEDASLTSEAERIALAQITTTRIKESVHHDVLLGTGGALLVLLAVHVATGSLAVLGRAAACADRLVAAAERDAIGASWIGSDGARDAGLAHGAAGIALAIDCFGRVSSDARSTMLSREAMRFARTSVDLENAGGWCRGAPGVTLASLVISAGDDLDPLLDATLTEASAVDHVCCGAVGRAGVLVEAGSRLGRSDVLAAGRSLLGRIASTQSPRLVTETRGFDWNPAFFQGLAGIGYEMLRATEPLSLPCVLRFE